MSYDEQKALKHKTIAKIIDKFHRKKADVSDSSKAKPVKYIINVNLGIIRHCGITRN